MKVSKFTKNTVAFTNLEDSKDFLVQSTDSDISYKTLTLSNDSIATLKVDKGAITEITIND
jgi:hypothetical protein